MSKELVRSEQKRAVLWLTLNSPETMNALSLEMLQALRVQVRRVREDKEIRCVVITGSGKAFSAGGDLKGFMQDLGRDAAEPLIARLAYAQDVFNELEALPVPVIAAVNGYAVAGGLELLLCCDIVLAAASARIGDGHARYGVIPAGGATARLPRKIGENRANEMFYTAELYPAEVLREWGLVNAVVSDEALLAEAERYAAKIASHSAAGLALIKRTLQQAEGTSPAEKARAEIAAFREYVRYPDLAEGLQAFIEKRQPPLLGTLSGRVYLCDRNI